VNRKFTGSSPSTAPASAVIRDPGPVLCSMVLKNLREREEEGLMWCGRGKDGKRES
jgi:hypothetical protein